MLAILHYPPPLKLSSYIDVVVIYSDADKNIASGKISRDGL